MLCKNNLRSLAIIFVLSALIGVKAYSQDSAVDAQTREQLKAIMTHLLETLYVSPEIGSRLASQLRTRFESGAYKDAANPSDLAQALTRDLREWGKDKHLVVRYDPAASEGATILTPEEWEQRRLSMFPRESAARESAQARTGLRIAQPSSPNGVPLSPQPGVRVADQPRRDNYNFREAKILKGNIGYLDLGGFAPGAEARAAAAKAMATLAATDALIVDLRRCPGGSTEMVNFLASYFFDKEPRVLMNRYIRPTGETIQSKTLADIPGQRMTDTDLYLLVGPNTASACESFPYTLQQYGRAKVVGERTAGAGYNNVIVPLGKGFSFSVSFGRPVHPRSGKGWEGEGVQPDIVVAASNALETAEREALQKLISKTFDQNRKQELRTVLQSISTRETGTVGAPASVTANLNDYVGKYGNKEISVVDSGLYYQRIGGRGAALRATGKDKFALNTDAQITFVRDSNGVVTEMDIDWVERDKEQLKREGSVATPPSQTITDRSKAISPGGSAIATELDSFLAQASASDSFSGAVLFAKDGEPVFSRAYGLANKATGLPNKVDTKFNLGSLNKMFTAVAIAQLVERGKLSFTDTVSKILPDYPNKQVAEKVTIHQLLTHTSGMGNYQNDTFVANLSRMKTLADLLPLFASDPLAFEPGTKWQYSNAGYALLGLIIEKVSGQDYFAYVKEHIFKPSGMSNTDSYERDASVPNLATGYTRMSDSGMADPSLPRRENTATRPAKGSSAGGGYSTVEDLLKFSVALQANKLLSRNYTEIVTTGKFDVGGPVGKYAYGFSDKVFNGRHIVGHNGGSPGIGANFDMFPDLGYTAVILTNYDGPALMPVIMKLRELVPANSTQLLALVPAVPTAAQTEKSLSQSEREVRKLEREWLDAYEQHDAAAMDRILADDFKLSRSNGSVQTKDDILAELRAGTDSARPTMRFSTEDVESRLDGDNVILSGRFNVRNEQGGQTKPMMQARYVDRYVKRNGRWQVVDSQMTRIP